MRETELPGVEHIHFNGGGNVAPASTMTVRRMRPILARRLAME